MNCYRKALIWKGVIIKKNFNFFADIPLAENKIVSPSATSEFLDFTLATVTLDTRLSAGKIFNSWRFFLENVSALSKTYSV